MTSLNHTISHARLKELVHYDPATGIFTAASDRSTNIKVGQRLGWIGARHRYWYLKLDGRYYRANRVAWFYVTGEWPPNQVDHRNQNKLDDRFDNLRLATNGQNQANISMNKRNTSGVQGVGWHKRIGKWQSSIRINGKLISLGYFSDLQEAAAARRSAEIQYFGAYAPEPIRGP